MIGIEYGNRDGQYFTQWRFDELTGLAEELSEILPDATGWRIWYDAHHDYHRLKFNVGGDAYAIRYYKVFAISKNGNDSYMDDNGCKNFGRSTWGLIGFFRRGEHLSW